MRSFRDIDRQTDGNITGWMDRWMDRSIDLLIDGSMDGQSDVMLGLFVDGSRMDGWIITVNSSTVQFMCKKLRLYLPLFYNNHCHAEYIWMQRPQFSANQIT